MPSCSRRRFLGLCSALAATIAGGRALAGPLQAHPRMPLVGSDGRPLGPEDLMVGEAYVFCYPYRATPCFLLRLDRPAPPLTLETESGRRYRWQGGVGPEKTVVAFAAICSHRLTYPTPAVSFIGYRVQPPPALPTATGGVIHCCSENSLYDPARGARVLSGPAPQPLAAVALEDGEEGLVATGVYGGTLYKRFFDTFGFRLELEYGAGRARQRVSGGCPVMTLAQYSRQRMLC